MTRVGRRDFIRKLPVLTAGLAGAVSVTTLTGCAGTRYLAPTPRPRGLSIDLAMLGQDTEAFLQTPDMERPIYLHRNEEGGWTAVLASCTHQGCQPEPVADRLVCPCHGSEFSLAGEVLQGPAAQALVRYDVTEEGDSLLVKVGGMGG
ncbi:MAG: Rieske (2Fe-2S) protein [Gemmatimonadetes bacterium]|nr:Rieske (2Fe-2S) protein [Gemmatimonadota bacterium]